MNISENLASTSNAGQYAIMQLRFHPVCRVCTTEATVLDLGMTVLDFGITAVASSTQAMLIPSPRQLLLRWRRPSDNAHGSSMKLAYLVIQVGVLISFLSGLLPTLLDRVHNRRDDECSDDDDDDDDDGADADD